MPRKNKLDDFQTIMYAKNHDALLKEKTERAGELIAKGYEVVSSAKDFWSFRKVNGAFSEAHNIFGGGEFPNHFLVAQAA